MPSAATIRGSIRTYSDEIRDLIPVYMEQVVGCLSAAYDVDAKINFTRGHAPVINDGIMIDRAERAAEDVGNVIFLERPSMGSDDFSFISSRVPSCYVRLGCTAPTQREVHPLHSEYFNLDEDCIQIGIDFLTNFALQF
jgi:amidohydrolase